MVFHGAGIGSALIEHGAVGLYEGDAQVITGKPGQGVRLLKHLIGAGNQLTLLLEVFLHLSTEGAEKGETGAKGSQNGRDQTHIK